MHLTELTKEQLETLGLMVKLCSKLPKYSAGRMQALREMREWVEAQLESKDGPESPTTPIKEST